MKKFIVLILLSLMIVGAKIDPNETLEPFFKKLSCEEAIELYIEAGGLHILAEERLKAVSTGAAKTFWLSIKNVTRDFHNPLLIRQGQVCKKL